MTAFVKDLRFALRVLAKRPGPATVAILSLALGIGGTTTIFSTVNAVILNPFPFPDTEHIYRLWQTHAEQGALHNPVSLADFDDWRKQNSAFQQIAAFGHRDLSLTGVGDPERLAGCEVSHGYFEVLGMSPIQGRTFLPSEEDPGRDRVAMVSHALWQRSFAGDPGIVGRELSLDNLSYTVVGVMPPEFDYPLGTDIWMPLASTPQRLGRRGARDLAVVGRLGPDMSPEQAGAEMESITAGLARQYPDTNEGWGARLQPIRESTDAPTKRFLLVLLAASVFVLLLACVNVATVQLARLSERRREVALRSSLGAGRWHIVRQFLAESVLLAGAGGVIGVLLAIWGVEATHASIPPEVYKWVAGMRDLRVDAVALLFCAGASLVAGVAAGIAPAIQASRGTRLSESVKEGERGSTGSRQTLRHAFVVAQVALALVLLVSAGLMAKLFQQMTVSDVGYNPRNLLTMDVTLPASEYSGRTAVASYHDRAMDALRSIPGVTAVGTHATLAIGTLRVEGNEPSRPGESLPGLRNIRGDYFASMGTALLHGRFLEPADGEAATPRVAVVSESVARRYWTTPAEAIGGIIEVGPYDLPRLTVIGVVDDIRNWFTGEAEPKIYVTNLPLHTMEFVIRTHGDPETVTAAARAAVQRVDPTQPIYDVKTGERRLADSLSGIRYSAAMMGIFAVVALVLAVVGIYGVVSRAVAQKTHDIGIHMALGARTRTILTLVIGRVLRLAGAGLAIGLLAAWGLTRAMSSVLYGLVGLDAATFLALVLLLAAAAAGAAYLPARRAVKVDPVIALRYE